MGHAGNKGQREWDVGGIFYIIQFSDFDTCMSMHTHTHKESESNGHTKGWERVSFLHLKIVLGWSCISDKTCHLILNLEGLEGQDITEKETKSLRNHNRGSCWQQRKQTIVLNTSHASSHQDTCSKLYGEQQRQFIYLKMVNDPPEQSQKASLSGLVLFHPKTARVSVKTWQSVRTRGAPA